MLARDPSSGVTGMIRVSLEQAKLEDASYLTFTVWMYRPNESAPIVCGFHTFPKRETGILRNWGATPFHVPVMQAFENARRFAEERDISAIWISDRDSLLKREQIEQMEQPPSYES
jgi:hypothetical protein